MYGGQTFRIILHLSGRIHYARNQGRDGNRILNPQNQEKTLQKEKLEANAAHAHKLKNSQQNTNDSNPKIHENNYTRQAKYDISRYARLVPHLEINSCNSS